MRTTPRYKARPNTFGTSWTIYDTKTGKVTGGGCTEASAKAQVEKLNQEEAAKPEKTPRQEPPKVTDGLQELYEDAVAGLMVGAFTLREQIDTPDAVCLIIETDPGLLVAVCRKEFRPNYWAGDGGGRLCKLVCISIKQMDVEHTWS